MNRIRLQGVIVAAALLFGILSVFGQQFGSTEIYGGRGGESFTDLQPPSGARVAEVRIRSGDRIDSVQMVFLLQDGRTVMGTRHGGSGGRLNTFSLNRDEYIIGLSGRCGDGIDSLRIHTNRRSSQLFGGRGGNREYRLDVPARNQGVGFAGRSGDLVDAIGLIYVPINAPNTTPRRGIFSSNPSLPAQFSQTPLAGGRGGSIFSDSDMPAGGRIAEVRIRAGERIDAVQLLYLMPGGRLVEGARHGGSGGNELTFRLDSDEYIIALSGRCGDNVDSLRIHTNKRNSPLFGGRGGIRDYRLDVPFGGQVVGFVGRSGEYLDAIGLAYMAGVNRR